MEHRQFVRIVPHARTAVLFIHGILGTPNHFRPFLPLVPAHCSVCNLLLDGHGGSVRDFSASSMELWRRQVDEAAARLCAGHENLLIVAHSMGTLFALEQAQKHPEQVKLLFLLAAPVKIFVRPRMVHIAAQVFFERVNHPDQRLRAAVAANSVQADRRHVWRYAGWIPRYLELFRLIRETRASLPEMHVPAYAFQSRQDEMVSVRSCAILRRNPQIHVQLLEHSGHFYYAPSDLRCLQAAFLQLTGPYTGN